MLGVPGDPIQLNAFPFVFGQRSIYGSLSGTLIDSEDALAFRVLENICRMIGTPSLEQVMDGYVRMIQGRRRMSMSSKRRRKGITEIQATSSQVETREVSAVNSTCDEKIRLRAYEIYLERGRQPGRELDDWLQAERELKRGTFLNPVRGSATADDTRPVLNCHDLGDC